MGILHRLAHQGSIQTRNLTDDAMNSWMITGAGATTRTGMLMSEDISITNTAVWNAIFQLSSIVGSLPLNLMKEIPSGQELAKDDPLFQIMNLKPNDQMTSMIMREALVGQMVLWGAGFCQVDRDGHGNVKAVWPLQSKYMRIVRVQDDIWYRYMPGYEPNVEEVQSRTPEVWYPRDRMLHIPYFSRNGMSHYRPVNKNKESLGLTMALEDYAATYFRNNAKPSAVIEIPGGLDKEAMDNFRDSWNDQTEGLDNAHKVAVLEEGLKLHEYSNTPRNSQQVEQREFQLDEVSRIFNIPPHMIKNLKRSTFSNIEEQSLDFVRFALMQILKRMEENYTCQLLKPSQIGSHRFKHDTDVLLQGVTKERWDSYARGFNMGVYSPNMILEKEGLNTYEGGDDRYVQLNMTKVENVDKEVEGMADGNQQDFEDDPDITEEDPGNAAPKDPGKDPKKEGENKDTGFPIERRQVEELAKVLIHVRNAHHDGLMASAQRYVDKEVEKVAEAARTHLINSEARNIQSFQSWMESYYKNSLTPWLRTTMFQDLRTFMLAVQFSIASTVGGDLTVDIALRTFMDSYLVTFVDRVINKSQNELKKLIRDSLAIGASMNEIGENIIVRTTEWGQKKAGKISRREANRVTNAIAHVKYASIGFLSFQWRTVGENCPFCNFLNRKQVGFEQSFIESGDKLSGEVTLADGKTKTNFMTFKSRVKHPPLHRGCDCIIVPVAGT